ncbi:hypothetical protein LSTR_LSTR016856 [Laodelphax striatellus]|uniref:Uncharacterized protein n=1 Tax=Laodelphax striatellus TaxID=195883 RepID=A0A482XHE9_LAOST|nr:hypothetical protein LSTR_LSTR016856 [Laodelphax striatellus]
MERRTEKEPRNTKECVSLMIICYRRCSRYQFECKGSGECIAIYNACDGIPQCSDASDEGPELGCPALCK